MGNKINASWIHSKNSSKKILIKLILQGLQMVVDIKLYLCFNSLQSNSGCHQPLATIRVTYTITESFFLSVGFIFLYNVNVFIQIITEFSFHPVILQDDMYSCRHYTLHKYTQQRGRMHMKCSLRSTCQAVLRDVITQRVSLHKFQKYIV